MVRYRNKILVLVVADSVELLGQRLTRSACESVVIEDDGFSDRLHLCRLVDERDADNIFVGAQLLRGLHKIPLARFLLVECIDQVLQCFVPASFIAGHAVGVLDLGKSEYVGVEFVDSGDDLRLLILESFLGECTTDLAFFGRNGVTIHVAV